MRPVCFFLDGSGSISVDATFCSGVCQGEVFNWWGEAGLRSHEGGAKRYKNGSITVRGANTLSSPQWSRVNIDMGMR